MSKYYQILIFLAILILGCNQTSEESDLVLSNVNIIDMVDGNVLHAQDIFISEGIISKIVNHQSSIYNSALTIDAKGLFVIPGLWDMHVHAVQDSDYDFVLPMNIANGITGIRDMGGNLRLRDSLQSLKMLGGLPLPRMMMPGSILGGNPARNGVSVATVEEAIEYVEILANNGADFIKTYEYLKPDVYRAILKRSNELNLPVYGHPPKLVGLLEAIKLGQKSFEHLSQIPFWCTPFTDSIITDMSDHWYGPGIPMNSSQFGALIFEQFDDAVLTSIAKEMASNEVYFCPTIIVYQNLTYPWKTEKDNKKNFNYLNPFRQWFWNDDISWAKENFQNDSIGAISKLENRKHILSILIENDVPIIAGTDSGVSMHGFDLHKELKLYVEAGMTPLEALQSATLRPSELLVKTESLGRVAKGYLADLVLLRENPLDDINNSQTIDGVVVNGNYVDRAAIDSALSKIKERHGKAVLDSLTKVIENEDVTSVLDLISKWKSEPDHYFLGGSQLTNLGYSESRNGRIQESILLLKKEVEINPSKASFASLSLVEIMGEIYGMDSAQIYAKRYLDNFSLGQDVEINSLLRRISDPTFGKPNYTLVDSSKAKLLEGSYFSLKRNEELRLKWNKTIFEVRINDQWNQLLGINDSIFYIQGKEPERILIQESKKGRRTIHYVNGRNTITYEK